MRKYILNVRKGFRGEEVRGHVYICALIAFLLPIKTVCHHVAGMWRLATNRLAKSLVQPRLPIELPNTYGRGKLKGKSKQVAP